MMQIDSSLSALLVIVEGGEPCSLISFCDED